MANKVEDSDTDGSQDIDGKRISASLTLWGPNIDSNTQVTERRALNLSQASVK
jgi:hypothetical protein